jgi:hypothetical protein
MSSKCCIQVFLISTTRAMLDTKLPNVTNDLVQWIYRGMACASVHVVENNEFVTFYQE